MNSPYKGKFRVSQQYKGTAHDGLDIVGVDSKDIYSTVDGVVERAGWENSANHNQGFGQYVRIKQNGTVDRYYFGHLSQINVTAGQAVKTGDLIGVEGSTGKSTGSHLHYCIRGNASHNEVRDVNAISGIPNEIGTYNNVIEGWVQDGNGWWYRHADGTYTKNDWEKIGEEWFYFDDRGYCAKANSWLKIDNKWYYFNERNAAVKGYHKINDELYYFAEVSIEGISECQLIMTDNNGAIRNTVEL